MKLIKKHCLFLLSLLLYNFSINYSYSQQEDHFDFMGLDRSSLLNSAFQKNQRIYSGNYNEVAYAIDDNTAFWFYFDENDTCNMFVIKKNKEFYERALLMLESDFPNKKIGGDLYFFWNSRMMATILKQKDHINIVYQRVSPQLLKK